MPTHRHKPRPQPPCLSPLAKWWDFELRFSRSLTKKEQRRLSDRVSLTWSPRIGEDGIAPTCLESKWPGWHELDVLTDACATLPDPRLRLAALGSQHMKGCDCHPWDIVAGFKVLVGSCDACGVDLNRCRWWRLRDGWPISTWVEDEVWGGV